MTVDVTTIPDNVALLFWTNSSGESVMLVDTPGRSTHESRSALAALGDEAIRWVSRHSRPLVLDDGIWILGRMQEFLEKAGLRSAAILPLRSNQYPVGAFALECHNGPAPFVFIDPSSMTVLGHLLSDAFERLRFLNTTEDERVNRQIKQPGLVL